MAEKRRQGLEAGIRGELAYVADALSTARFLLDKASKDAAEADGRASRLYSEYLEFDAGEYEAGDGCDYGLGGAINSFLRNRRNAEVQARREQREALFEAWRRANAEYEELERERKFYAEEADDYEKRARNCGRFLKMVEKAG